MKSINYQVVPSTIEEDYNSRRTVWNGGKIQSMDEGSYVTMFIGHKTVKSVNEDGSEVDVTEAFPVRVQKPYSIDKAVMAGVMSAYGLFTQSDYTAFVEDIAQKRRIDESNHEVSDYDMFVDWIRGCLDGTYKNRVDEVKAKVLAEIESYDKSEKVNGFTYNGKIMWLSKEERLSLVDRFGREIEEGVEQTNLFYGGEAIPLAPADALVLVKMVSSYADKCFDQTQRHINNVNRLSTVEELEAYDITAGYPDKLNLKTKES